MHPLPSRSNKSKIVLECLKINCFSCLSYTGIIYVHTILHNSCSCRATYRQPWWQWGCRWANRTGRTLLVPSSWHPAYETLDISGLAPGLLNFSWMRRTGRLQPDEYFHVRCFRHLPNYSTLRTDRPKPFLHECPTLWKIPTVLQRFVHSANCTLDPSASIGGTSRAPSFSIYSTGAAKGIGSLLRTGN